MSDHTATTAASVYEDADGWQLDLSDSAGEVVETIALQWDGRDFHGLGLNVVARALGARRLRYRGWTEMDGRYLAVLYQAPSWGPR